MLVVGQKMLENAGIPVVEPLVNRVTPQTALWVIILGNLCLWAGIIAIARWFGQ